MPVKTPFEIHITTANLSPEREDEFVRFCRSRDAKPLMIELSRGEQVNQPMFSKTINADGLESILEVASGFSKELEANGFGIKRLKIEIPSEVADRFANLNPAFEKYFEWHAKINFEREGKLLELCEKHKAHLSQNALKNNTGTRFVTLREFGTKEDFENRITRLTLDLTTGGWVMSKQEAEYCVYDNNKFLDRGWLPQ